VRLDNVSSATGVLTLAGPRSRELLQALTDADVTREAFPFFTLRELDVAMARVRALRLSFVGELGFELHHPVELQRHLYDALLRAGERLGLVDFGYRALESMRLEKGYRLWGADISADYTPLEAGLERFVRLEKGEFVGRAALVRQRDRGVERTLTALAVDAADADAHGHEPVYAGDEPVAFVASGGYGHRTRRSLAFAYLPPDLREDLSVEILGERRRATVLDEPPYDPRNERLLA
jgi:dimethylglycine dehydrogenase